MDLFAGAMTNYLKEQQRRGNFVPSVNPTSAAFSHYPSTPAAAVGQKMAKSTIILNKKKKSGTGPAASPAAAGPATAGPATAGPAAGPVIASVAPTVAASYATSNTGGTVSNNDGESFDWDMDEDLGQYDQDVMEEVEEEEEEVEEEGEEEAAAVEEEEEEEEAEGEEEEQAAADSDEFEPVIVSGPNEEDASSPRKKPKMVPAAMTEVANAAPSQSGVKPRTGGVKIKMNPTPSGKRLSGLIHNAFEAPETPPSPSEEDSREETHRFR